MDGESCGSGPSLRLFGVPDGSEAPAHVARFARSSRDARTRPTSEGTTAHRRSADSLGGRIRPLVVGLAVAVVSALSFSMFLPEGHADDLTDRRAEVKRQIKATKAELNHSSKALNTAAVAVTRTRGQARRRAGAAGPDPAGARRGPGPGREDGRETQPDPRRARRREGGRGRWAEGSWTLRWRWPARWCGTSISRSRACCRSRCWWAASHRRIFRRACSGRPRCSTRRRPRSTS